MTIAQRLQNFRDRGFNAEMAAVLVLIEEALHSLFTTFPNLYKAEAFLDRTNVKPRDAFDIKLLMDTGAELDNNLTVHLQDGPISERLEDPEFIRKRIDAINPKLCEAELRRYLPDDVFQELARQDFEPLRQALRNLFSEWL